MMTVKKMAAVEKSRGVTAPCRRHIRTVTFLPIIVFCPQFNCYWKNFLGLIDGSLYYSEGDYGFNQLFGYTAQQRRTLCACAGDEAWNWWYRVRRRDHCCDDGPASRALISGCPATQECHSCVSQLRASSFTWDNPVCLSLYDSWHVISKRRMSVHIMSVWDNGDKFPFNRCSCYSVKSAQNTPITALQQVLNTQHLFPKDINDSSN